MLDTNASTTRRLIVSRVLLVVVAIAAAYVASTRPADILSMVAWAFSLAAAGLFPALVLGIWWKRTTTAGAIAGIITGFGVCVYYLLATRYFAPSFYETWGWLSGASAEGVARYQPNSRRRWQQRRPMLRRRPYKAFDSYAQSIASWWGIKNLSAAAFGLPVGLRRDDRGEPPHQGAVEGDAGHHREHPRPARAIRSWKKRPPDLAVSQARRGFRAPPSFVSWTRSVVIVMPDIWTYWYFHIPNFVLAALVYTLIGRFVLGFFVPENWDNYIWRAFRRLTDPVVQVVGSRRRQSPRTG